MPKNDSLTINLVDLDNLIQLIAEKKPAGGCIEIVKDQYKIVVRDAVGMQVGTLPVTNTIKDSVD